MCKKTPKKSWKASKNDQNTLRTDILSASMTNLDHGQTIFLRRAFLTQVWRDKFRENDEIPWVTEEKHSYPDSLPLKTKSIRVLGAVDY